MTSTELRRTFLAFFQRRGHAVVPSSSLIPDDPSVLLTTAGMQQFKPYFLGSRDPLKDFGSLQTTSIQKSFRTTDIEVVGDETHLTFFEMLGNFSFGGYFKKEAISYALEFLAELGLRSEIDFVTVFAGDERTPFDKESFKTWQEFGFPEAKIKRAPREDNFWGPTGKEGPCGPTTEIYMRGAEVWNLVFNEYYCHPDGRIERLKTPGVDTGMGLDRLAMVSQGKPTIFETDLHAPALEAIASSASFPYRGDARHYRIIADHIRGACFLIADGVLPSNLERGYILRRILRRCIRSLRVLELPLSFPIQLAKIIEKHYSPSYPELKTKSTEILTVIEKEAEKFGRALEKGLKEFEHLISKTKVITGQDAFKLYESYGFPLEMTVEMALEAGGKVDEAGFKAEFVRHQEVSKKGLEKKFSSFDLRGEFQGVQTEEDLKKVTRLHTATHLLHQALRTVLGSEVKQMGSNITPERLRFDFSFPRKASTEELQKISDLANQKIREDLPVTAAEMSYEEALASGALAFFKEKYPEKVSVYSVGNFSRELCGGPHVKRSSEVGTFKILKEEASASGVRRIRATVT